MDLNSFIYDTGFNPSQIDIFRHITGSSCILLTFIVQCAEECILVLFTKLQF